MDSYICSMGYSLVCDSVPSHFMENILTDLCVKPLENPNFERKIKEYPVYRMSQDRKKIYIPRYYGIEKYGQTTSKLKEGQSINCSFVGNLRNLQQTTIEETIKTLDTFGGGLISLDTGLGKTVVALKLISLIGKKTLIIVHAEFLLEQWSQRIKQFLPDARIGIIRQSSCEYSDCDIVIGMLQSIIKRDYPPECYKGLGMMIIDEAHHICSKSFSSIFYKVQTKYMIGLSATPDRKDGLTKVLYWFLGPQIVDIKRESDKPVIKFVYNQTPGVEKFNKIGKLNNPIMITDLTLNKERNELIIKTIQELLVESRKILVLSERRNHCEYLVNELKLLGISCGLYLGGMKQNSRNETVETNVIIGTYQASGEGFDVPTLDTLILSTPKSDIQQAVGRILRQKNQNTPLVMDIVDCFSLFRGMYYKRKKFYNNSGIIIRQ